MRSSNIPVVIILLLVGFCALVFLSRSGTIITDSLLGAQNKKSDSTPSAPRLPEVNAQRAGSGSKQSLPEVPDTVRRPALSSQSFQPMAIPQERDASFDYKAAMMKLNEANVSQDDPRLITLIRDYYLVPPSKEPYNLDTPDRLDYSNGQTPFVDSRLNYIEGGFYVEAGALNGEKGSNTLFFEKVRKWNGLLVEADPSNFALLMKKHRKAYVINACLSTKPYPSMVTFNKAFNMGRIVEGEDVKNWMRRQSIKKNEVQVQCFPLYSILLALNQLTVDFFSLDVEGDELNVIKTIPINKVNIKMLTVEFVHETGGSGDLKTYVERLGYDSMLKVTRWDGGVNDIIFRKKGLSH